MNRVPTKYEIVIRSKFCKKFRFTRATFEELNDIAINIISLCKTIDLTKYTWLKRVEGGITTVPETGKQIRFDFWHGRSNMYVYHDVNCEWTRTELFDVTNAVDKYFKQFDINSCARLKYNNRYLVSPNTVYVLDVYKFNTTKFKKGEKVGCIEKEFKTKQDAILYYNNNNPHMRPLNAHRTLCSDWDPVTKLYCVVRAINK